MIHIVEVAFLVCVAFMFRFHFAPLRGGRLGFVGSG
jgi:hypothetical protein